MHGGASWGVNAPTPAQLARLKIMRSAMTSSLSTTIARSMCHPTWKGDYPVLGAEWVPFERTQCIIAALENGILVVHNVVSNTRVPLFTPFDIRTFSSSTSSSRGRAVAGGAHAESSTPRPGQTVAASLKYGSINAVAVAAQKPNQLIASDHSMVMAWNYQDHIATCCIDAGRREPVPTGLSKIAAIPSGLTPEDIHIKFSPYFYTSASTSMKKVCSRLLVCVVSESETASSRLMVCMQDEASCKAAVTSTSGTASSPSTTTGITANGASTSSPSATYPKFNTIIQPWKMIHGEVIHVQWISPTGPTSEATDVSVIHAHPPALLVGTSDGRLTILRITLPSTTTTTPISTTGNDDSVGAQVFSETVFVSSSAVSHLDVQMFSSTYNQQAAAHAERQKAAPKTTSPSLTVKCDYVLYFVALGNIVHNATISISWLDLFGVGDASPSSPSSASVAAQIGTKRARSEEGSEPTTTTDSAVVTSTTPSSAPQQQQKQLLTVFVTPLTSTCTDDAVVYGIQSALISSSFVLYCFVSSSVIALDGATLSTLFVTPFTRHRSGISTSSSTSGGAAGSSSSAASGALFSSALATRPIKLVPRDKPPFLGVVDGERFVLLRDGNSVSAASSTTTPVAVSAPSGGHHHGGTTHSGGSAGGGGYHNSHHGGGGGHHSGHHNSHHRR